MTLRALFLLALLACLVLGADPVVADEPAPTPPPVPAPPTTPEVPDLPEPPAPAPAPASTPEAAAADAPTTAPTDVPELGPLFDEEDAPESAPVATEPPIKNAKRQPAPRRLRGLDDAVVDTDDGVKLPSAQIDSVVKVHDQPWKKDLLALRLDVEFTVSGHAERDLRLAVWFALEKNGELIEPTRRPFADGAGHMTVQTLAVRVAADGGCYSASLWLPYLAFPAPTEGDKYTVEARVLLIGAAAGGADPELARQTTTFTVHGAPQEAPVPDVPPAAPEGDAEVVEGSELDSGEIDRVDGAGRGDR